MTKEELFGNINLSELAFADFKEASVRESIIMPILKELGYNEENIVREKTLKDPVLRTGKTKTPITLIPDYTIKIGLYYAWILEAKNPSENINTGHNVEQAIYFN